tara:strand:- start:2276 stop:2557 length:282 start_codon:yes stop_codon:yes gene_type:complete
MADLVLFTRKGCCLCEGLEQRLRDLDLQALGLILTVLDIDSSAIEPQLRHRYDLEVPVLQLDGRELARVSPRLQGDGLFNWLQRGLSNPPDPV